MNKIIKFFSVPEEDQNRFGHPGWYLLLGVLSSILWAIPARLSFEYVGVYDLFSYFSYTGWLFFIACIFPLFIVYLVFSYIVSTEAWVFNGDAFDAENYVERLSRFLDRRVVLWFFDRFQTISVYLASLNTWDIAFALCSSFFIFGFYIIERIWCVGGLGVHFMDATGLFRLELVDLFTPADYLFFYDNVSMLFCFLTILILPVCAAATYSLRNDSILLLALSVLACFLVLLTFSVTNFFNFFIAFESTLFPMFFIIGRWGSRSERSVAAYMLYLYTSAGSIFFIGALLTIGSTLGTFNFFELVESLNEFNPAARQLVWWCCFIAFAFKVPLFPFHTWLTVAHVEAPTVGSVILASLLLKIGGYGMIRFLITIFPDISQLYQSTVMALCLFGGLIATVGAFRQLDLKRFIAYTSIAHMHFLILILFTLNEFGYWGAIHGMLSHGLIAAGLFFLVGALYERVGVRITVYLTNLVTILPVFGTFWALFLFANAGLPFFSGFVSEFLGFMALFATNVHAAILSSLTFILGVVYAFLMQLRILFGSSSYWLATRATPADLTRREVYILLYLLIWVFIAGLIPEIFISSLNQPGLQLRADLTEILMYREDPWWLYDQIA